MSSAAESAIHAAVLRVRNASPFFASLLLFARIEPRAGIATAATDGDAIYYNPDFLSGLARGEVEGVLVHEVLHCALLHVSRRGPRDPTRWNVAADIVVNGMLKAHGAFRLPDGAVLDQALEHLPVEEVYELLPAERELPPEQRDLLAESVMWAEGPDQLSARDRLRTRWQAAIDQAGIIAAGAGRGTMPAGFHREFGELSPSRVDWRTRLWQFVVQTPSDFAGFDRRFIGQGLYLDAVAGEKLTVEVAIDSSGSIRGSLLSLFVSELRGILGAYPHITCRLYYADSALHGPWTVRQFGAVPAPVGGGGTSFVPFCEALDLQTRGRSGVAIYLTDGFGSFPKQPPRWPMLWLVPPGGADDAAFPFGSVVRLRPPRLDVGAAAVP
ncbi:MAG: hypothetical protein KA226_03935 [Gemmatimonadales bacterium]|nr:hypothetical protein [Gemmatimonadales bacterium]